jgi:hypothetical protein
MLQYSHIKKIGYIMNNIDILKKEIKDLQLLLNNKQSTLNRLLNKQRQDIIDDNKKKGIYNIYIEDKEEQIFIDEDTLEGKEMFARLITQTHIPDYQGMGLGYILYNLQKQKDNVFERTPEEDNNVPNFIKVKKGEHDWGIHSLNYSTIKTIDNIEKAIYRYSNGTTYTIEVDEKLNNQDGFICEEASYEEAVYQAYKNAKTYVKKYKMII